MSLFRHRRLAMLCLCLALASVAVQAKTIGILVYDKVLSSDITAPAEVFGIASRKAWFSDYDVKLINVKAAPTVTTEEGLILAVDGSIHDQWALDVLLVPSAYEMDHLHADPALMRFLRQQGQKVDWLASNCSGAFLLADAGLLDNYRATTWAGGEPELADRFPKVKVVHDSNVVVDRNRITSNGSLVSYQAALVLLGKMSSPGRARSVFDTLQMQRLMDWQQVAGYLK